jgi:hypothetical protein
MARSRSRMPRRVVPSFDGWRAWERPRPKAWLIVSGSCPAVRTSASAWSGRWRRPGPASSRQCCQTRCATSNPPLWAECVDLGSEPAREQPGTGVDPSVVTTRGLSSGEGSPRSGLHPDRTVRLDKAGTPTSPALPARREWDHPRTSSGTARTVEAVVQHGRAPAGSGTRPVRASRLPIAEPEANADDDREPGSPW